MISAQLETAVVSNSFKIWGPERLNRKSEELYAMELLNQRRIISEACQRTLCTQYPFQPNLQYPWQGRKGLQIPLLAMDNVSP